MTPYHGHEGLRQWWANVDATFEELEARVEEVRDLGDAVLALGHLRARFRSGVTLDTAIGWLTRYRDGLAVWGRAYQRHTDALEAARAAGVVLWTRSGGFAWKAALRGPTYQVGNARVVDSPSGGGIGSLR
jgi:ketosteroid isomerase-like protein